MNGRFRTPAAVDTPRRPTSARSSIVVLLMLLLACPRIRLSSCRATELMLVSAFQPQRRQQHQTLWSMYKSRDFFSSRQHARNVTSFGPLRIGTSTSSSTSSSTTTTAGPTDEQQQSLPFFNTECRNNNASLTFSLQMKDQVSSGSLDDPTVPATPTDMLNRVLSGFWGPRIVLAAIACFYATNFPLGTVMADAMPSPSAVTSARMVLAAMALSPFISKLDPSLRIPAIVAGCCTSTGYIAQSMALVDTNPATVSFLGSATVLVCPFLEWAVDKKPMSWKDAPQTWLAAILCLLGIACLELLGANDNAITDVPAAAAAATGGGGGGANSAVFSGGSGDLLALMQAVGFGTQVYMCERMLADKPDQALPVTATLVATAAALSGIWCVADGWMSTVPDWQSYTLPGLFFEPSMQTAAAAILWTGIISTALSFLIEMNALSRVPPAQAAVILATEPMWAALFAAGILGETFGTEDVFGGMLMIAACIISGLEPKDLQSMMQPAEKVNCVSASTSASTSNTEESE